MDVEETCTSTHASPTAGQPVTARCSKPAGHDPREGHEGRVGIYPIYWTDEITAPDPAERPAR